MSKLPGLTKHISSKIQNLYNMGRKADEICIVKVITNIFHSKPQTFLKFLFCEWFVAFSSLICICKMLIDGRVIHLYWNNGLP